MLRHYRFPLGSPGRLKYALVLVLVLLVLVRGLHSLKNSSDRRQDGLRVGDHLRYLYHSTFRDNPDIEYEQQLSNALRDIEKQQLALSDHLGSPNTLWQILLVQDSGEEQRGDDSFNLEEENWDWEYKLVTTEWADEFVTLTLSSIPGLASLYHSYPHNVLRADLLRYLILWYYGGYYADVDVFPARSIKNCPSLRDSMFSTNKPDVSLVVGIEIDEPLASPQKMREWHWVRSYGFIQYTMYAPRRFSPLLREVIVRVLSHTKRHNDESNFLLGPTYNELLTLEITGPGVFTDAILDVLSDSLPARHPLVSTSVAADPELGDRELPSSAEARSRVTWAPFYKLQESLCVESSEAIPGEDMGGLCVLPINAWGNGQRHSGSDGFQSEDACINHRFGGTWKPWRQSWKKYLFW